MSVIRMYKQLTSPDRSEGAMRSFTETWLVELDDPQTSQGEIENAEDYPYIYMPHPERSGFFAIERNLDQDVLIPNIRKLIVDWSTRAPDAFQVDGQPGYPLDPIQRPLTVQWGTYKTSATITKCFSRNTSPEAGTFNQGNDKSPDVDKKGVLAEATVVPINTAGDLIFIQDQIELRMLQFSKNVRQLPQIFTHSGQFLNSDTVRIRGATFSPRELLAADITVSDWQFENGIPYLVFSYNWYVAGPEGWLVRKRNVGFNEKVTKYRDKNGKDVANLTPGGSSYEVLRPIEVGPIDNRHYPSQPVLLRPNGSAFRSKAEGNNPDKPNTWTGEIMSIESRDEDFRTQAQKDKDWTDSEITFRTKPLIPFAKYFPLK